MPRFTPSGPRDTTAVDDGDYPESSYNLINGFISIPGFKGLYSKGSAAALPRGFVADAVNVTFRDGTARTRLGMITPTSHQIPGNPRPIYGSGVFSDPTDTEYLLLAVSDGVWRTRGNYTPRKIKIPSAITGPVQIVQAFTTVLIFRGSGLVPWAWDDSLSDGFVPVDQSASDDGTVPIPNGPDRIGLKPVDFNNRLIVPHDRSQLAFSDIFDYTRYDNLLNDFNVTNGDDSILTGIFRYPGGLLLLGSQSLQLLTGVTGDLSGMALQPITNSVGCISGRTVQRVGNDVFFLAGATGVYDLFNVQQVQQTAPVPVSDPIEPLTYRINWQAAQNAVASVLAEYYYLAVPVDGSPVNNAILPYSSTRQAWEGLHTFPAGVQIDALHRLDWFGSKRLHAVDYASGAVYLMYEGRSDMIGSDYHQIPMSVTTRSYMLSTPDRKRFRRGRAFVRTWAPSLSVSQATDSVNNAIVLASAQTRDRTQYKTFGAGSYDPSNANGGHGLPYRWDYSIDIGTPFNPDGGIDFDLEQEDRIPFVTRLRGRTTALTVSNTQGTLALEAVVLEGEPSEQTDRPVI